MGARNDEGIGTYGCILPFPGELVHMKIILRRLSY
ncbi:hypothetical protein [Clostridium sp. KNHs214]